ncbi:uncharacterized beta-barrel protein YwiB (DUF1934 family) [Catenibacillus scindens]|uniref:Uncharacterized beta-barrel protein YwiB (DUF1934 family) n=1 Tax=Catenibacillus scindens TaxID=673271 RepID=A0A7W8H791_9FIRM|nr:DUF1934 domain-containing protein [Catenibacillus scindens]MBB5263196.1 uncharacterized beta-barrel protein YwiB (DUF1934 family) [Catenibacillus scindens]
MTKDVIVSISGLQMDADQAMPLEVITVGSYYYKNGKHYILFDEMSEDGQEQTRNTIKITDNRVDVIKKGESSVHMIFEPDTKNMTYYQTPFGNLLVGINTLGISHKEDDLNINTKIDYALDVNYAHMSDCSIEINIKSKEDKNFRLQ